MKRRLLRICRKAVSALPRSLRHRVLRRLVSVDTTPPPGLSIRLAQNPVEARAALRLLHDAYVSVGLMDPHPSGLRTTPYQARAGTRTIIAELDGEIVATVSLIADSTAGLPLETVFAIDSWRQGRKIAEISAFAVRPDHRGHGCRLLLPLLNYTYLLARDILGLDAFVMAPLLGRADLYEAVLLAERLHDETVFYPYGNGLEVAALSFNLHDAEERYAQHYGDAPHHRNLHHYFFIEPPDVFELPEAEPRSEAPTSRAAGLWELGVNDGAQASPRSCGKPRQHAPRNASLSSGYLTPALNH